MTLALFINVLIIIIIIIKYKMIQQDRIIELDREDHIKDLAELRQEAQLVLG